MNILDIEALANLSPDQQAKALVDALAGLSASGVKVDARVLADAAKKRREDQAAEAKRAAEEAIRVFESAKSDLERRLSDVVSRWISKNEIVTADLVVPPIVVREGALTEPLSLKAKPKGRAQSIGAAPRGTLSLEGRVGKVEEITANAVVYPTFAAVVEALGLPAPTRESMTRTLVKIAGAKVGQFSGGVEITAEHIEKARAVVVKAELMSGTMGEIVDRLKNGNGSSETSESEA